MKFKFVCTIIVVSMFAINVQALDQYVGGGFTKAEYSEDGVADDASMNAIIYRYGVFVNSIISLEARAGFGMGTDNVTFLATELDVELDHVYGLYTRYGLPSETIVYPYLALGYTKGKITIENLSGASSSEREDDWSYGGGIDFRVLDNLTINTEYLSYIDKSGAEISGFTIGITGNF